jgi:hypothetical protein
LSLSSKKNYFQTIIHILIMQANSFLLVHKVLLKILFLLWKYVSYWFKTLCCVLEKFRNLFELKQIRKNYEINHKSENRKGKRIKKRRKGRGGNDSAQLPTEPTAHPGRILESVRWLLPTSLTRRAHVSDPLLPLPQFSPSPTPPSRRSRRFPPKPPWQDRLAINSPDTPPSFPFASSRNHWIELNSGASGEPLSPYSLLLYSPPSGAPPHAFGLLYFAAKLQRRRTPDAPASPAVSLSLFWIRSRTPTIPWSSPRPAAPHRNIAVIQKPPEHWWSPPPACLARILRRKPNPSQVSFSSF